MSLYQTSHSTWTIVQFHTWDNGLVEVRDVRQPGHHGPLKSMQTNKRLGDPAGTFELGLTGRAVGGPYDGVAWSDLLTEGDWMSIEVVKDGAWKGCMVGKIDDVGLSVEAGATGEASVTVNVRGRDAGAPLVDCPIYFNPHDPVHNNAAGLEMARVLREGFVGPPQKLIPGAIRGLFASDGLYGTVVQLPPTLAGSGALWVDLLGMDLASAGGTVQDSLRGGAFTPSVLTMDGAPSVWSFLDGWRNPVLNEMWVDSTAAISPRRWYLNLRERPFVNRADGPGSPWFRLTAHDIDARTVVSASLSKGLNRINHIMLFAEPARFLGQDAYALYPPVADFDSVRRYGLRKLEESTRFYDVDGSGFTSEYKKWLDLVVSWNANNAAEFSGTIVLADLRPEIRVGQKVQIVNGPLGGYPGLPYDGGVPGKFVSFYVEGVAHRWTEGRSPMAQSVLTVSRGFVEGSRVDAVATAAAKFAGSSLPPTGSVDRYDLEPADARQGIDAATEKIEVA